MSAPVEPPPLVSANQPESIVMLKMVVANALQKRMRANILRFVTTFTPLKNQYAFVVLLSRVLGK